MLKLKLFINDHEFEVQADKPLDLVELVKSLDAKPAGKRKYTKRAVPQVEVAKKATKVTHKVTRGRTHKTWSQAELDILWNACMAERKNSGKINLGIAARRAASQLPGRSYIAVRVRASDLYYALIGNDKSSTRHMRSYVATKVNRPTQTSIGTFRIPVQEA